MAKVKLAPHETLYQFIQELAKFNGNVCWKGFSVKTQQAFAQWTLDDLYARTPEAAKAAQLGIPEVRLMFEKNEMSLFKTFWKRFITNSGAVDCYRFGQYVTHEETGNQATVRVNMTYPNGTYGHKDFLMVNEKGGWKLAYVEANLPF
jgi:hypothetical protein